VGYPSDEAYMLRHICLLFFLFSSIPSILHKMVTSAEYRVQHRTGDASAIPSPCTARRCFVLSADHFFPLSLVVGNHV
jgi:hypothetical protein